jgi:hypothetical protein
LRFVVILSWNQLLASSLATAGYRGYGFTIPLCCWPFPQLCGFPTTMVIQKPKHLNRLVQVQPSSRVLTLLILARLPRQTGSSLGLCVPYSTRQIRRSTGPAVFQAAFVPSSGFGYPRDGFPFESQSEFETPTALLGFSPSKLDSLVRKSGVSTALTPPAVFLLPDAADEPLHGGRSRGYRDLTLTASLRWRNDISTVPQPE